MEGKLPAELNGDTDAFTVGAEARGRATGVAAAVAVGVGVGEGAVAPPIAPVLEELAVGGVAAVVGVAPFC